MEHALIFLATGLILNVFHGFDAELNLNPRDTEVKVSDSTYMNCSTTSLEADKVQWRHGDNYVYRGTSILEPYNVRFSVEINSSTGTSNLVIRSVQPSDAGQYECLEDEGFGERRSAQLIVLDDDPVCKSNMHSCGVIGPNDCDIEPDEIKLSCSVTYHGNIFPILQWKTSEDNQPIKEGLLNLTSNKNEVTYTLTMKSTLDQNNSSFICQTTRTSKRNYSCSSDVIKILYVFNSNVTIRMTINDEVLCFANASQSCSYKWKWFSGDDSITVSNDQTLKPNRDGWHRCEATCHIGNKSCTVAPTYAEVYSTPATSGQKLLALLVLVAVLLIVVIGVIIYRWRKNKIRNTMLNVLEEQELVERKQEQQQQSKRDTLSEKYKLDPVLIQAIRTRAAQQEMKEISGLTILDKELFVVSHLSSEVEVYDSMKLSLSRRLNLKELIHPWDLGSCNKNKCLYIFGYKGSDGQSKRILRLDRNGKLIKNWSTGDDFGYGLSVTDESNVILTVFDKNKLNEYSPDGQMIREINLSLDAGILNPLHAVKLTNGHFVVSQGFYPDDLHRVCLMDGDGKLKKSFGGRSESNIEQMVNPCYLAIDGNEFVMVADRENKRVLLLDSDLQFKREILSEEKHGLRRPERILVDQRNGRLFVADNDLDNHQILIFQLLHN